ncbi:FliO/MopB family protein, partial [Aquipuribacter hungaricus]|uniref:FliO/MopB family protein n=1 Tax=Aquipuribacter hungaricus TaxID=545624 RepID=UPI0030EB9576
METAQMLLRAGGGLLAVLGTVWVLTRVVAARTGTAGSPQAARLRVVARASLGRHTSVVSVDAGDRVLVLGVGEHGVRLLAEQPALPEPEPVAEERVEVLDLALPTGAGTGAGTAAQTTGPAAPSRI